jgi:DNA polymerase-3 subunit beta
MKLRVTQEKLAHALLLVGRVATSRAALPVLANVLLKAENNQLLIVATNLEIAISQTLTGKIEKTGSLTVPARLFSDYITSLPQDSVDLETDGAKLKIKSGSYSSTINGVSAEEFPTLPSIKGGQSFSVDAGELKNALQETVFTASNDETRPVLTGAFIHTFEKQVYIASTDSYRLAQKQLETKPSKEFKLIVPANALGDVQRIIGDGSGEVKIKYDDTQVQFIFQDSQLITRQIDGAFPEYRQLIPDKSDVSMKIDRNELLNITKVAALFARESAGSITLEVTNNTVSITSVASQVGENNSQAQAKTKGEGKVTLNSRYLIEALNVVTGNEVEFRFSGKVSPCVLTAKNDPNYLHIIMPLKS